MRVSWNWIPEVRYCCYVSVEFRRTRRASARQNGVSEDTEAIAELGPRVNVVFRNAVQFACRLKSMMLVRGNKQEASTHCLNWYFEHLRDGLAIGHQLRFIMLYLR